MIAPALYLKKLAYFYFSTYEQATAREIGNKKEKGKSHGA